MAERSDKDVLTWLSRGWRAWAVIAALTIAAALPGFSRIPALDRDEARFAQATRQMLETGDFVRIQVQDEPRAKKPIGIHWLQAATVTLSGAPHNAIWAYRLASLIGALLAAAATFWAGLALFNRRTAFLGAALFAPGMLISAEAAIAKTDAALCGLIALALAALAHLRAISPPVHGGSVPDTVRNEGGNGFSPLRRPAAATSPVHGGGKAGRAYALLFWAALGAGVLVKGPVAPIVCGLTVLALAAWERRIGWMKPLLFWPGPALAIVIVAPWAVAISIATQGAFFTQMFAGDLAPKIGGGQEGHGAPPGYHLVLLAALLLPAVIGLGQALVVARRALTRRAPLEGALSSAKRMTEGEEPPPPAAARPPPPHGGGRREAAAKHALSIRFLLCWIVPTFLFFEALPTKLAHYTLPTFPALALLCAVGLLSLKSRGAAIASWLAFALGGAALVAVTAYVSTFMPGDAAAGSRRMIQVALLGGALLIAALIGLAFARTAASRAAIAIAFALATSWHLRERVLPEARALWISHEAALALRRTGLEGRPLLVIGYRETSMAFETRTEARLLAIPEGLAAIPRAAPGTALLIHCDVDTNSPRLAMPPIQPPGGVAIEGLNYSNGDRVCLAVRMLD